MTREEAIAVLRREIEPSVYEDEKSIAEAVDMAIEALQKDAERQEMIIRASERHLGIVRCKDCIHWLQHEQFGFDKDNDEYHDYCALLVPVDDYYAYTRKTDDFCSYGERREP